MKKFGTRPKTKTTGHRSCRFCNAPIGAQYTSVRHKIQTATTVERKDTTHGYANKEQRITGQ